MVNAVGNPIERCERFIEAFGRQESRNSRVPDAAAGLWDRAPTPTGRRDAAAGRREIAVPLPRPAVCATHRHLSRGDMNNAYISAFAALAGSGIGAIASFATTWLTQDAQERARRVAQAMTRRERLYGEFIEEASKLFTDALTHQFDDPSKFVRLYALVGKLRLCAPSNVIAKAEEVMQHIVEVYHLPTEISAIRKTGSGTTSMCFGRSAKLVAKTWAFR